jgi:hypothetical protein
MRCCRCVITETLLRPSPVLFDPACATLSLSLHTQGGVHTCVAPGAGALEMQSKDAVGPRGERTPPLRPSTRRL